MTFLKVEPSTLRAKGQEITADWPTVPAAGIPPSMLFIAGQAAEQIRASRDRIAAALEAGKAEAARLAACLESAAVAYETVDDIKSRTISGGQPAGADSVVPPAPVLPPAVPVPIIGCPENPDTDLDVEWMTAAGQINAGDQGFSLSEFAAQLYRLSDQLTERGKDFSLADTHWEGKAAEAAEAALRQHESWLYGVAEDCRTLAGQAQK